MVRPLMPDWIPLVRVVAVGLSGFTIYWMHGVFGSQGANADGAGGRGDDQIVPVNPKRVLYEVFGPVETVGSISYLDENARPQRADFTALPWSFQVTTTLPWMFANLAAQGTSDTIGCRSTVNGELRENESAIGHDAQVFCLVKAA
ncbi:MAG: transport acessory protein MmpS [Mycolicibacterium sp.]|nr:transport acessory protein MmpS [Mycolicibacterium sp.]